MSSAGLQPQPEVEDGAAGQFLTFVVPALSGCNLKCSFCLVRQRREITDTNLRPGDLVRFIREAAERAPIFALAIQGYEPLLPESLPYTQAILATGRFLGLPTSLVTNGTKLVDAIELLTTLAPNKIAISLDAASADIHDHIRGVAGAWAASVGGIKRAIEVLAPRTRLVVSSVLLPSKRHYLEAMPARLREIGIDRWIINPLLRVGSDQAGGPVADRASLYRDLLILQEAAARAGIRLTVDDEFDHLGHDAASASQPSLRALHLRTLPPNVEIFRLAPSGQCSAGGEILRQVTPDTPRWQPGARHAGDFLEAFGAQSGGLRRRLTAPALVLCALVGLLTAFGTAPGFSADLRVAHDPRRPPEGPRDPEPPKPKPEPKPLVPIYNWTGFYIGGNVGGAWDTATLTDNTFGVSFSNSHSGFVGGSQIGYNWQLSPQFVVGIEWMFDGRSIKSDFGPVADGVGGLLSANEKVDWITTLTGRLGYAANNWLFYAKAGGGWVHDSATVTDVNANGTFSVSASDTKRGWVVGGGIEHGFTPNWTGKVEYQHLGLGDVTTATGFVGDPGITLSRHFDMVTIGLNYKF